MVYGDGPLQLQCLACHSAVICVDPQEPLVVFLEMQLFSNYSPFMASWLKQLPVLCSLLLFMLQVVVCFPEWSGPGR